ncbi:MFS transporter [Nocardiopsis changdeensis]|uniref:MFS transporter n=1 Tax=Nocardiopsis changdeensis TaxID=2831969 RepID=A0ABX8BJB0_9ACTN|nr:MULTISPECIES: MFS transporter [Nocardiopsis]QUX20908.1 MFS transporter [Nocardiopsis changdeensis]QYX36839.1 MFS transporter [Nocardiopsis sp. MT53]
MSTHIVPGALPEETRLRLQRRTVAALMLTQVVGGVGMGAMIAVGALIALDLTGSDTWSGMATTMITLGAAVFALPLASLAARRGRRPGLGLGWAMGAVGGLVVIAAAVAELFPLFLLGMVLVGAGTATNLQARHAAVDLASDRSRGRDLSVVVWATTVGSVLGPNLTAPGARVAAVLGLPDLLGPVVFTTTGFVLGALLTFALLRPDPLLTAARAAASADPAAKAPGRLPVGEVMRIVAASPGALLAVVGIVCAHTVMVAVMTMTPVHMSHHGAALTVIGLTISLHIAGMYAFSPLVGWLSDRLGRIPVLLAGQAVLLAATAVSGTAGHDEARVTAGLFLLGLGWSLSLVSGTALLAGSLEVGVRPRAQGVSDLLMNLGGAAAGGLSGVVLSQTGFGGLNLFAALFTVPVFVLALRAARAGR